MSTAAVAQPQASAPLEHTSSRPSLTHSHTSGSGSTTADESTPSHLHLQLNPVVSSDNESETLNTPVDPPSFTVHIKNGLSDSPINIQSTIDEEPEFTKQSPPTAVELGKKVPSTTVGAPTPKKGRLNLSKSMQNLRKKKEKTGRERASSFSEKDVPAVPSLPTVTEKSASQFIAPAPAQSATAARPARPSLQTKSSSGGFSSFLRKLTGRSTPTSSPTTASESEKLKEKSTPAASTVNKRKTLAFGSGSGSGSGSAASAKPALARLDTSSIKKNGNGPTSAPPKSATPTVASPLPITPATETDPCKIPLPPSPTLGQNEVLPSDLAPAPAPAPTPTPAQSASVTRKKAEKMLSFEGFEFDEEEEEQVKPMPILAPAVPTTATGTEHSKDQSSEVHDVVQPLMRTALAPIRIPSRSSTAPGPQSATSPRSAAPSTSASFLSSSVETKIVTPLSATSIASSAQSTSAPVKQSPERAYDAAKSIAASPPKKSPAAMATDLGRKESKWRKSVMNLSEKTSKRQSVRPPAPDPAPPTSQETYMAQQARTARNRQSCAPNMQSTAAIAAAARNQMGGMKLSKEDQEMAETFFMS